MSALSELVAGALRQVELELAEQADRDVALTIAERWARDPEGWIDEHVWLASKFAGGGISRRVRPMRMRLFPDQRKTIAAWIDLERLEATGELVFRNVVIEKSRQIGETWLFAAVLVWALHYHPIQGLMMHQRAAEVADRGFTIKSFLGKMRYIDRKLDRTIPGLGRLQFYPFSLDPAKVVNETNGAGLYGECQRDDPGRGGTFDFVLVDEAAFVRHGESVWAALSEACEDGVALLSTVNGSDNFHARIADERPAGWVYLRLHWSSHPIYGQGLHVAAIPPQGSQPGRHAPQPAEMLAAAEACELCAGTIRGERWVARAPRAHRFPGRPTSPHYDRAVIGKTAEQVASELDIDRDRSLKARVYDEFQREIHVYRENGVEAALRYDPALELELGFDYGIDVTSVVVCQDAPAEYRLIGEVEVVDRPGQTPTAETVCDALRAELAELGVPAKILERDWTRRIYARGDPSGDSRTPGLGITPTSAYKAQGFQILPPPRHLTRRVDDSVRAVKNLLLGDPKPFVASARCERFVRHATHNRWPTDAEGNRRAGATKPLDDEHNHMMRAFGYLAVSKFPPKGRHDGRSHTDPWDDETPNVYGSLLEEQGTLGYDAAT